MMDVLREEDPHASVSGWQNSGGEVSSMRMMNGHAFKEWSVVCAALARGKQTLILRKGGIEDGSDGIRVENPEFWLYPTYLHQESHKLAEGSEAVPAALSSSSHSRVSLQYYAVVYRADFIATEVELARLQKFHIWPSKTIVERFHYRRPGIWSLIVRIYERPQPYELVQDEQMAGCRTWVDLPEELSTAGLTPVLSDHDFQIKVDEIEHRYEER